MQEVIAAADFGSNKTGYVVARAKDGSLVELERASRFTRLAEGMDRDARIGGEALARTLDWCAKMRRRFGELGVARFRGVGTEALRRASNREEVLARLQAELGWPVEVIPGEEEGRLTFLGVRTGYPSGPLAVIDVGGGSTELILGGEPPASGEEAPEVMSLPLGAVLLTERHGEDWEALLEAARGELRAVTPRGALPGVLTVLGGTGANLTMMDRGEKELRDEHVEGHVIERSRLEELRRRAAAMSPKQRVARLGLPPQRADIQIAGLAIVEAALDRLGIGAARTSRYALRHGVLRSIAPKEA